MAYYDRDADILFVEVLDDPVEATEERDWGLVDRTWDGRIAGVELWDASHRIEEGLLNRTPAPRRGSSGQPGGVVATWIRDWNVYRSTIVPPGEVRIGDPRDVRSPVG